MQADNKLMRQCLIFILVLQVVLIFKLSQNRLFNFDEFQVLYASASLVKGKALYQDGIGIHFPLVNIFFALMLKTVGFKTIALLVARLIVMTIVSLTLYLIYKLSTLMRDAETGLLAVVLTMSSIVFVNKGIEIRHDVFNMFFNVAGVYWAIRYLKTDNKWLVVISGVCLGLALASTQKALIWNLGIIAGLSVFIIKEYDAPKLFKILLAYALAIFSTIAIIMLFLITVYHETFYSILKVTILDTYSYLIPNSLLDAKPANPFFYDKSKILKSLFIDNGPLYLLSIICIVTGLKDIFKKSDLKIIIVFWALIGLLFFLYMKRPFYQSLLPTIPSLGILAAIFLTDLNKRFRPCLNYKYKRFVVAAITFSLVGWPMYLTAEIAFRDNQEMAKQMKNVSFCLQHLDPGDKVLCFSAQQIFFDPIFRGLESNECGHYITAMDEKCFKQKMIENKCKIVIYDYRTIVLNNKIKAEIKSNYLYAGTGHIFISGFRIKPSEEIEKMIWTPGIYYCPTLDITVNGKKINTNNLIRLNQQVYSFKNLSSEPTYLRYVFHRERFRQQSINMQQGAG